MSTAGFQDGGSARHACQALRAIQSRRERRERLLRGLQIASAIAVYGFVPLRLGPGHSGMDPRSLWGDGVIGAMALFTTVALLWSYRGGRRERDAVRDALRDAVRDALLFDEAFLLWPLLAEVGRFRGELDDAIIERALALAPVVAAQSGSMDERERKQLRDVLDSVCLSGASEQHSTLLAALLGVLGSRGESSDINVAARAQRVSVAFHASCARPRTLAWPNCGGVRRHRDRRCR